MKTHRSTELFLYCSGGERSVNWSSSSIVNGGKSRRAERCGSCLGSWECWNTRNSSSHVYCVWQTQYVPGVFTSARRDSAKDAHHCKTIRARDRPIEPLRLMWLRGLMVWYGKTDESQRNKLVFGSGLAMAPCVPLSKITCSSQKFARSGFRFYWRKDKRLTERLHVWAIFSCTKRNSMRFCNVSSQRTKRGATIFSPRENDKPTMETPQFSPAKDIQRCPSDASRLAKAWSHNQCEALCRYVAETVTCHKVKTPWNAVRRNHPSAW